MNEEFTEEVIEEVTPTPEAEEVEEIETLTVEEFNLAQYSVLGMGTAGACVIFSLGVGAILKILKSL